MDIHKLLKRQLDKACLNSIELPQNSEHWKEFIQRVNKTYTEADQDRYMHERSMEIFSREMMGLNEMLEKAQRIAGLGYWSYDGIADSIVWSKELFTLFNIKSTDLPTTYEGFLKLVHEDDRDELMDKVSQALNHKVDYQCDIRVRDTNGNYHWFRAIGQCTAETKQIAGVIIDVQIRKESEKKINELNQKIASTARRAGMAEVATSILHNIGNILNSLNVSISLLQKSISQPYHQRVLKIATMLNQHCGDMIDFLTNDPKGQLIPEYLSALSAQIGEEQQQNTNEIDNVIRNFNHINEIVAMQKSLSGLSSINEKVYIPEVIDSALNMTMSSFKIEPIEIVKQFEQCPMINIDKSKLLQILVNLIQNAKDSSFLNSTNPLKEIKISIKKINNNRVQILIADNGIGIDPHNIERIFSFGFTTKKEGHGFGLHSSALSAQEMGGSLIAQSNGINHGALFILTLPIERTLESKGAFNE